MGKRGRKTVFIEVEGRKGSKTFIGKASKVTLCNKCGVPKASCNFLNSLKSIIQIEAPVYGCNGFLEKPEAVEPD